MRLLLVEDDRMIGEGLVKGLRDESFAFYWVRDRAAAAWGGALPILMVTAGYRCRVGALP